MTTKFNLGKAEETKTEAVVVATDSKAKSEPRVHYPCVYVYDAAPGLAKAMKELPTEGGYARIKLVPTRLTETSEVREGKEKEASSVEFEIHEIELEPAKETEDAEPAEDSDEFDEAAGGETRGGIERLTRAARKLGITED